MILLIKSPVRSFTFWIRLVPLVNQFCFVGIFPNFSQCHSAVESKEDTKRKSQFLNDHPRLVTKKFDLNWRFFNLLNFKCINDPDGKITNQEKCNNLPPRLGPVLISTVNPTPCYVLDEEELKDDLENANWITEQGRWANIGTWTIEMIPVTITTRFGGFL